MTSSLFSRHRRLWRESDAARRRGDDALSDALGDEANRLIVEATSMADLFDALVATIWLPCGDTIALFDDEGFVDLAAGERVWSAVMAARRDYRRGRAGAALAAVRTLRDEQLPPMLAEGVSKIIAQAGPRLLATGGDDVDAPR
jgi:hypothetical protein